MFFFFIDIYKIYWYTCTTIFTFESLFWHVVSMRRHRGPNLFNGQIQMDWLFGVIPIHNAWDEHVQLYLIVQSYPDQPGLHWQNVEFVELFI